MPQTQQQKMHPTTSTTTEIKRKRGRPKKILIPTIRAPPRKGSKPKRERFMCPICGKPGAVKYTQHDKDKEGKTVRRLIYEHRDEKPIDDYWYTTKKGKKQHHLRYRRCNVGLVKDIQFPILDEPEPEPEQEQIQIQIPNGKDWEKKFNDLVIRHKDLLNQYEQLKKKHLSVTRCVRMAIEAEEIG